MNSWISVDERLPKVEKTYLVKTGKAARIYHSNLTNEDSVYNFSYDGQNHITGDIAFSTIKLNYKKPWSIERSPGDWARYGGRVIAWAYLPGEGDDDE